MTPQEQTEVIVTRLIARGIGGEEERPVLSDCAAEVLERVENYIHQPVPQALLYTCTTLTADLYQALRPSGGEEGEIQTMSVGDTTITYGDGHRRAVLDTLVGGVLAQLGSYRTGMFRS